MIADEKIVAAVGVVVSIVAELFDIETVEMEVEVVVGAGIGVE